MARIGEFFAKSGERCVSGRVPFVGEEKGYMKTSLRASLWGRSSGNSANLPEQVAFRFHDLEITSKTLVMHFFDEKTVIPLKDIKLYHLKWYLHDPIFAKKWWFLVLTVDLKNGEQESDAIAETKFNYASDQHDLRQHIESKIADAINAALRRRVVSQKGSRFHQDRASLVAPAAENSRS